MKSNSYNLSPQAVQFYVDRAHQMRKEFIVQHLRRGYAALAEVVRKAAKTSADKPRPSNFFTTIRMWDA